MRQGERRMEGPKENGRNVKKTGRDFEGVGTG